MGKDELANLVRFDPDQVRDAIARFREKASELSREVERCLKLAATYSELLQLHGFPAVQTPVPRVTIQRGILVGTTPENGQPDRIQDRAVTILQAAGGRLHAKKVLQELQKMGRLTEAKYPMSSLVSMMRRDPRVQKDPSQPNTWRLKEGH